MVQRSCVGACDVRPGFASGNFAGVSSGPSLAGRLRATTSTSNFVPCKLPGTNEPRGHTVERIIFGGAVGAPLVAFHAPMRPNSRAEAGLRHLHRARPSSSIRLRSGAASLSTPQASGRHHPDAVGPPPRDSPEPLASAEGGWNPTPCGQILGTMCWVPSVVSSFSLLLSGSWPPRGRRHTPPRRAAGPG